jgi:hypothetical protein
MYNGNNIRYIDMKYSDKIIFINTVHKKGDVYLCKKSDIKVKIFDTRGNCDHTNLKSHIMNIGNNEIQIKQHSHKRHSRKKRRSIGRVPKRLSRKKLSKKRRSIGKTLKNGNNNNDKNKNKNKLIIYGSENCIYCGIADKKAVKMKNIYNFDYKYEKYEKDVTIKEAIKDIRKITGKSDIMSIPVYVLNGSVVNDPYVRF